MLAFCLAFFNTVRFEICIYLIYLLLELELELEFLLYVLFI